MASASHHNLDSAAVVELEPISPMMLRATQACRQSPQRRLSNATSLFSEMLSDVFCHDASLLYRVSKLFLADAQCLRPIRNFVRLVDINSRAVGGTVFRGIISHVISPFERLSAKGSRRTTDVVHRFERDLAIFRLDDMRSMAGTYSRMCVVLRQ
jgi:hypothetical protein